jgi:uncharacterized membrane protein (TIGR02234 family)
MTQPPAAGLRPGTRSLLVAAGVLALGGLLLVLCAGRTWATTTVTAVGGARQHLSASGRDAAPGLAGAGWGLLALAVATVAGNGVVRRLVGAIAVLVAAGSVASALRGHARLRDALLEHAHGVGALHQPVHGSIWWGVAAVAGLVAAAAGAGVAIRGGQWAGMGARYDAPGAERRRAVDPATHAWEALDRGDDPTADGSSGDR